MKKVIYFVSTYGNDNWSGKLPEPNKEISDGPFATLKRARDVIRELKSNSAPLSYTVIVRGGKYYIGETLEFNHMDSGTRDCPVTYEAYGNENPILSGGIKIIGWKKHTGNILYSDLSRYNCITGNFRQLFYKEKILERSRWPKTDFQSDIYSGWAFTEEPFSCSRKDITFSYRSDKPKKIWSKPEQTEACVSIYNGISRQSVRGIDQENKIIKTERNGWHNFNVSPWFWEVGMGRNRRFFIENILEEIEKPGEWCYYHDEKRLYIYPPEDFDENSEVVIPVLDCVIDMENVSWMTISGFGITETNSGENFHREGVEGAGCFYPRVGHNWKYCGEAIHLNKSNNCIVTNNHIFNIGGNAVYMEADCQHNTVSSNEIAYTGANGICIIGSKVLHPFANQICDNHIQHCGIVNNYAAGIFAGMSDANVISHNCIEYTPHHGINLSENPYGRNLVEYNTIRFTCRETIDNGAINCWMELPDRETQRCGHIIRFNYISDVYGCTTVEYDSKVRVEPPVDYKSPSSGIYLDNYTSNCIIQGNICVRCNGSGVLIQGGKNNIIEDNIFVNCDFNIMFLEYPSGNYNFWVKMKGFMTGNHIIKNIFYQSDKCFDVYSLHWWTKKVLARCESNVIFREDGKYSIQHKNNLVNGVLVGEYGQGELPIDQQINTLNDWNSNGYDQNSILSDPMFEDASKDDYRLKCDSPAFKNEFRQTEIKKIGIRKGCRFKNDNGGYYENKSKRIGL